MYHLNPLQLRITICSIYGCAITDHAVRPWLFIAEVRVRSQMTSVRFVVDEVELLTATQPLILIHLTRQHIITSRSSSVGLCLCSGTWLLMM
jgi:hypothetical protein